MELQRRVERRPSRATATAAPVTRRSASRSGHEGEHSERAIDRLRKAGNAVRTKEERIDSQREQSSSGPRLEFTRTVHVEMKLSFERIPRATTKEKAGEQYYNMLSTVSARCHLVSGARFGRTRHFRFEVSRPKLSSFSFLFFCSTRSRLVRSDALDDSSTAMVSAGSRDSRAQAQGEQHSQTEPHSHLLCLCLSRCLSCSVASVAASCSTRPSHGQPTANWGGECSAARKEPIADASPLAPAAALCLDSPMLLVACCLLRVVGGVEEWRDVQWTLGSM